MAFMSTSVVKGHGKGIVVKTGLDTEIGKISTAITTRQIKKTELQKKIQKLGFWLVILSIILCSIVTAIGLIRKYLYHNYLNKKDIIDMVKVGVSLAISVIPEGFF